ncbi:TIM barrel protein [Roseibium salinum]|uniref:TIM barrel protein n=1 Tax=Roseibium salinum TaxID=1604349 RepID=A0ABT3QWA2_9HYPH|nr:TIM barrel protein [Roseibium sp. DSM 29163]MCX2721206.1 TIM barrel protein [Roseibium sp. DSM 29163]MDN3722678.1 TIM barrel protein [Roseibium salinum]
MLPIALNHMTVPSLRYDALFTLARKLGCIGVELRNDLDTPLFDGDAPQTVAATARQHGLRIVGLSQVYPFNDWSDAVRGEVRTLIETAVACGAETISLIPRNDGQGLGNGERQANLRVALREIKPMLDAADMVALIEPLGFMSSSLRSKAEAVEVIESLRAADRYKLVHDTFHHHLAGEDRFFPEYTGIVHVSGVIDPHLDVADMRDGHRILVDGQDRLGNVRQLNELFAAGYSGPVSYEAFSPVVHRLASPEQALAESISFMRAGMKQAAA